MMDALALTQADSYTTIIVLALPLGLIEAMATASLDAIPPRIVPDDQLVTANALLGGAQDVAIVIGPLAAARGELHGGGLEGAFIADAATFLVGRAGRAADPDRAGAARSRGRTPRRPGGSSARASRSPVASAGLRWTLTVASCVYALWAVFGVLEPLYVRDVLGGCDAMFALLQTVFGVGLVLTGLLLAVVGERDRSPALRRARDDRVGCHRGVVPGHRVRDASRSSACSSGVSTPRSSSCPPARCCSGTRRRAFHGRVLSLNQSLEPTAGHRDDAAGRASPSAWSACRRSASIAGAMATVGGVVLLLLVGRHSRCRRRSSTDPTAGSSARRDRARRRRAGLTVAIDAAVDVDGRTAVVTGRRERHRAWHRARARTPGRRRRDRRHPRGTPGRDRRRDHRARAPVPAGALRRDQRCRRRRAGGGRDRRVRRRRPPDEQRRASRCWGRRTGCRWTTGSGSSTSTCSAWYAACTPSSPRWSSAGTATW